MCPFSHGLVVFCGVLWSVQFIQAASVHERRQESDDSTAQQHGLDIASTTSQTSSSARLKNNDLSHLSEILPWLQALRHLFSHIVKGKQLKTSQKHRQPRMVLRTSQKYIQSSDSMMSNNFEGAMLRTSQPPQFGLFNPTEPSTLLSGRHNGANLHKRARMNAYHFFPTGDISKKFHPYRRSLFHSGLAFRKNSSHASDTFTSCSHCRSKGRARRKRTEQNRVPVSSSTIRHSSPRVTQSPVSTNSAGEQPLAAHRMAHSAPLDPAARRPPLRAMGVHTPSTQRSLLSSDKNPEIFIGIDGHQVNISHLKVFFEEQAMERKLMQQAQWAYLCLVLLICLMLWALWYLGARCQNRSEIHVNFQHNEHLMSMKEVLWRRRHYLPMAQEPEWEEVQVCDCGTNPR